MNEQVMIYEVKASANSNFDDLYSPDRKYYYWNQKFFKKLKKGDFVYVVNTHSKKVLFTKFDLGNIETYSEDGKTIFEDLGTTYEVSGEFDDFIRLNILNEFDIPDNWNYKSLGSAEITYLNGSNINTGKSKNRLANIECLKELSDNKEFQDLLGLCETNFSSSSLYPQIVDAINSDFIKELCREEEFRFQKGLDKLEELEKFSALSKDEISIILSDFKDSGETYTNYVKDINKDSPKYLLFHLMAQLISYCDLHAANKKELNEYPDNRTIARVGVRQTDWILKLLAYKVANNDIMALTSSLRNVIYYIKHPRLGLTMLSENHREMVSLYLLKKPTYIKDDFVTDLISFFKPYNVDVSNEDNRNAIYCSILYHSEDVKKLWFEHIDGLVVADDIGWIEKAIKPSSEHNSIVLWWDKSPTGGKKTIELLKDNFENDKSPYFHIYYTVNKIAKYRSKVIDIAFSNDYKKKEWNNNDDVAWHKDSFSEYKEVNNDRERKAKILFLVSSVEKLESPISIDDFIFYKNYNPPTQNKMQPFVDVKTNANINDIIGFNGTRFNNMGINLNTILYGPPGTGKTYNTINYALDVLGIDYNGKTREDILILYNEKVKEGRIVFTTFHQSISYEDFIEGIKPITKKGNVTYEIKSGIFKKLCTTKNYFKVNDSFGSRGQYRISSLSNSLIQIERTSGFLDLSLDFVYELVDSYLNGVIDESYFGTDDRDRLHSILPTKWDKYLLGYNSLFKELVKYVSERINSERSSEKNQSKVIIIDEINRGNIANIFGELITLIEDDKRMGEVNYSPVILPYSGDLFGVPNNLFILGTMNTADRSVESLDTALRRRFSFVEMDPKPYKLNELEFKCEGINLDKMLEAINLRIEKLLDKDYCIGHSYFMKIKNKKDPINDLRHIFKNKILPLMQEYFYGDWGKIMLVLGSNFIRVETAKVKFFEDNLQQDYEEYEDKPIYRFTKSEEWSLDSFKSIYE